MQHAMIQRIVPDRFIWILLATIALASFLPVRGRMVEAANLAGGAAVFVIFLLHGIRLSRGEVLSAITNARVHGAIAAFIFIAMPIIGIILERLAQMFGLPHMVALGFLFCGVLPTTVQSATTYTSLARGNAAISVVASAINNLAAIALTPLLFALLAGHGGGVGLSGGLLVKIATILLLPFALGQALQRWTRPWVLARATLVRNIDQSAIAIAVYVAFSAAVVAGLWQSMAGSDVPFLALLLALNLLLAFGGAWVTGGMLRADHPTRIAILFCGAQKSVAVGAPLAALLFPPSVAGMILLPVLFYHLLQLMLSAWLATHFAHGQAN